MAFSATKVYEGNIGGKKYQVYDLNFASVTEGLTSTGFNRVDFASFNNDVTETDGLLKTNFSDASTASNGDVFINGVTSDDTGKLFVIGS